MSLALLTDLYQLLMAYGYWKEKMHERKAVFHLFFRRKPFKGNYALAAGLEDAVSFIKNFHFDEEDLAYLASLKNGSGAFFEEEFLYYLKGLKLEVDLDAVEEGTAVFPYEPILRVQGPLLQAQLLESPLLNIVNFQTLIATKASRILRAAEGDPVVEFGMRRAQGKDGAISASRAAFIGGCESTSHVLAGKLFHIPVKGTQAHSYIMAFDKERDAFSAFAKTFKESILLVDTYDSLEGTRRAIEVAKELKLPLKGIRLDSGDMKKLSFQVRKILDLAGFFDTKIMASNELDEWSIAKLKKAKAPIDIWGVGTHLVTAKDQPALDGVYKLSAVEDSSHILKDKMKISEDPKKSTLPGLLQVRRKEKEGRYLQDVIYEERIGTEEQGQELLIPILKGEKLFYTFPSLQEIQKRAKEELLHFDPKMLKLKNPKNYPVLIDKKLLQRQKTLAEEQRMHSIL